MVVPQASGRVTRDADGLELLLERSFHSTAGEIWNWFTDSGLLERWIGIYSGIGAVGGTVEFTMTAEGDPPPETITILACEQPHHLLLEFAQEGEPSRIGISLAEVGNTTTLFFRHRIKNAEEAGSMGVGWEYYLDRLIAARDDAPTPDWDDYYPAMVPYFERLASATP